MDILGERIRQFRHKNNYTLRQLGEKLNISFSLLAMYERGERTPPIDKLIMLADCFSVSIDYLLGRKDEQNVDRTIYTINDNQVSNYLVSEDAENFDISFNNTFDQKVQFYVRVEDNSMKGCRLLKGDLALINTEVSIKDGHICLVYNKNEEIYLLRKVFFVGDKIILKSAHLKYKTINCLIKEIEIIGRVIRVEFEFD